ncbi:DUF2797 domain-containing protein [Alkaliflexus imshenetskii]|uniref:DUF2797 domain-containing protein n=1 Tax=Alkaliflexus imshenetskii TaxID=286730 RepID=UPI0004793162|nr:DUF2797 domain-containing protein [Alkaliflexus imshenetskii]
MTKQRVTGNLLKMLGELSANNRVHYYLELEGITVAVNDLVGQEVSLLFMDTINCISCGKVTKKSFAQGFCFSCMQTAPEADDCVLRPALCKAHLGVSRNMEWARGHCLQSHYVYLANTGDVKVGVTRESQVPVRWIDQGATSAVKLCKTPNRHMAGLIEQYLSRHFTDKTSWKKMVTNNVDETLNLIDFRERAISLLTPEMRAFVCEDAAVTSLLYPVDRYPTSPVSLSFDAQKEISGRLSGVKGQYILFDDDRVLNIRRHTGYLITLTY